MNEEFAKRVRAPAIAGWCTLLIASVFLAVQWPVYLWMMSLRPMSSRRHTEWLAYRIAADELE